jgi:hypothetical protein
MPAHLIHDASKYIYDFMRVGEPSEVGETVVVNMVRCGKKSP